MSESYGNVYVRRLDNREIVYTIPVTARISDRTYEQFMRGLLRKTDQTRFFVDDSGVDFGRQPAAPEPSREDAP